VVGFRKVKVACRRSRLLGPPRSWTVRWCGRGGEAHALGLHSKTDVWCL